jgi:arylsulfatase A-like enzyme
MKLMARMFFAAILTLQVIVLQAQENEGPVNIIMILADDLGWADVNAEMSRLDIPNLRRLQAEGITLTNFYSSASMCSPARAAFLTGRYPHSVGMPDLASPTPRNNIPILALDHSALTIPEALKPYNYRSMLAGKWHLGFEARHWPRTHGFDEFHGSLIGTPGFYDVKETYHNETPVKVHKYFTDYITDQSLAFMREKKTPFFLYVAYNAPHYPLEAPADLVYKYRMRFPDDGLYAIYAAMIERMDQGIGKILNTMDSLDLSKNTLIVFSSDNGPSAEPRTYGLAGARLSAGPLRDHKYSTHEGGIRVPFIARWPGRIPAGVVRNEPAVIMDMLPTFLDAARIKPDKDPEIHGISVLPLLENKRFANDRTLFWEDQYNLGVRKGNWKLVHRFYHEKPFLYDLSNDIGERRDVAAANPKIVTELLAAHAEWKAKYYPNPVPRILQHSEYIFPSK